jgi:hypothetical protein
VFISGQPAQLVRIYIDSEKLKKLRGVYIDPESLNATEEEFEHSFMVIGGIPREAIIRAEVVEIPVRPREDFILKGLNLDLSPLHGPFGWQASRNIPGKLNKALAFPKTGQFPYIFSLFFSDFLGHIYSSF